MPLIPVTVYTNPNCVQCDQTKKQFDKLGIIYTTVDLSQHPELVAKFRDEHGFTAAPIVTTDIKMWSGFRLAQIKSLAGYIFSQEARQTTHGTETDQAE